MQKELLFIHLLNLIDKLFLWSVPINRWDGKPFPDDLPPATEVPDSIERMVNKGDGPVWVVPEAIINEIAVVTAQLEELIDQQED